MLAQRLSLAGNYCDSLPVLLREAFLSVAWRLTGERPLGGPATPDKRVEAYAALQRLSFSLLAVSCLILGALIVVAWTTGDESTTPPPSPDGQPLKAMAVLFLWDLSSRHLLLPGMVSLFRPERFWTAVLVGQAFSYALLWAVVATAGGLHRAQFRGFRWAWAARGYLLCTVTILATDALVTLLTGSSPFLKNPTLAVLAGAPREVWPFLVLLLVVLGPCFEELLFRGYLLGEISAKWGTKCGLLLSSLLFALAHGALWNAPSLFAGGLVLGWVATRTGSLGVSILAHSLWNLTWLGMALATLP